MFAAEQVDNRQQRINNFYEDTKGLANRLFENYRIYCLEKMQLGLVIALIWHIHMVGSFRTVGKKVFIPS